LSHAPAAELAAGRHMSGEEKAYSGLGVPPGFAEGYLLGRRHLQHLY
jgi:hypothetical protein